MSQVWLLEWTLQPGGGCGRGPAGRRLSVDVSLAQGASMLPASCLTGCTLRKRLCSFDPAACCQGDLAEGGRDTC